MFDSITRGDQVDEAVRQSLGKADHHVQSGTIEPVFDRGKTILDHAPLRRERYGIQES